MNRKIDFRAWVYCRFFDLLPIEERKASDFKKNWVEKWVMGEVKTIHIGTGKARVIDGSMVSKNHDYKIGEECILMQFTGRHDTNGKKIYEGDILQIAKSEILGSVEYRFAEFVIARGSFVESLTTRERYKWKMEVVGNIYENNNLIK